MTAKAGKRAEAGAPEEDTIAEQELLAALRETVLNLERVAEEAERASRRARERLEAVELGLDGSDAGEL